MKKLIIILVFFIIFISGCTSTTPSGRLLDRNCSVDSDCKIISSFGKTCSGSSSSLSGAMSISISHDCVSINENDYCNKVGFRYHSPPMGCVCDSNTCKAPETDEEFNRLYNKLIEKCEANESKKICYHDIVSIPAYIETNRTINFCKDLKYFYECFSGIFDATSENFRLEEMPQTRICEDRCSNYCEKNAKYWCFITSLTNNTVCDSIESNYKDFCFYGAAMFEFNPEHCNKINSSTICNNCGHFIPIMLKDDCYYSLSQAFSHKDNTTQARTMCNKISNETVKSSCYEIARLYEECKTDSPIPCFHD